MEKIYLKGIALLTVFIIVGLLPFANKAFHIDDTLFLYSAKSILKDFTRPYDFNINWSGTEDRGWDAIKNPPVSAYILALLIKIFSERELPLHAAYIIFPIISIVALYFLARKFVRNNALACVFLFISPAFFVSSQTLMSDIPQIAFYLTALALYIQALDKDKNIYFVLSGLFAGLAILTKYTAVTVIPVLLLYNIVFKKSYRKAYLSFVIPLAMLALWGLHGSHFYGKPHFLTLSGPVLFFWEKEDFLKFLLSNVTVFLIFLSGLSLFVIFSCITLFGKPKREIFALSLAAAPASAFLAAVALSFFKDRRSDFDFILAFLFIYSSLLFLAIQLSYLFKNKTDRRAVFLFGWFFLNSLMVTFNYTIAARFMLLTLPPAALLVLYNLEINDMLSGLRKKYIYAGCALIFLVALLVAHSDYRFAESYRNFSAYAGQNLPDKKTWFIGHWGFQYYMERSGFKALDFLNAKLEKDDLIIVPISNSNIYPPERLKALMNIIEPDKVLVDFKRGLFNITQKAGFYSSAFGPLPYAPEARFSEIYQLYRLTEAIEGRLLDK